MFGVPHIVWWPETGPPNWIWGALWGLRTTPVKPAAAGPTPPHPQRFCEGPRHGGRFWSDPPLSVWVEEGGFFFFRHELPTRFGPRIKPEKMWSSPSCFPPPSPPRAEWAAPLTPFGAWIVIPLPSNPTHPRGAGEPSNLRSPLPPQTRPRSVAGNLQGGGLILDFCLIDPEGSCF